MVLVKFWLIQDRLETVMHGNQPDVGHHQLFGISRIPVTTIQSPMKQKLPGHRLVDSSIDAVIK